jgi:hypothetical protein
VTNGASVNLELTMTKTPIRFTILIAVVLLSTSGCATISQATFKTPATDLPAKSTASALAPLPDRVAVRALVESIAVELNIDPPMFVRMAELESGFRSDAMHPRSKACGVFQFIAFDAAGVTFRYTDYRRTGADRQQVMTLATDAFIRRFLLHILPRGFHRIRHYGLLAGSARKDCLALARQLLEVAPPPDDGVAIQEPTDPRPPCPCCGGTMVIIEAFAPWCQPRAPPAAPTPNRESAHDPA